MFPSAGPRVITINFPSCFALIKKATGLIAVKCNDVRSHVHVLGSTHLQLVTQTCRI